MSWPHSKRWAGKTAICLASGPSMCAEDAKTAIKSGAKLITVNSTWRMAPSAHVHYSSDHDWWETNIDAMRDKCLGEFWTGHPTYEAPDVQRIPFDKAGRGLNKRAGFINWGGNSGYCAIGVAHQFGARRILLLGYDQCEHGGAGHWHEDHPASIKKAFNWPMWKVRFDEMAADAKASGIEIINCSRVTALRCFPQMRLQEALLG